MQSYSAIIQFGPGATQELPPYKKISIITENNAADVYGWSYKWFVLPLFMQDYKGTRPKKA